MVVTLSPSNTETRRRKRRAAAVNSSSFCSAFTTGCKGECSRVNSSPKHEICRASPSNALQYSLSCQCKNGKSETQHALAAAVNQEHVASVSTVTTSTLYTTATATSVVPSTVLTTSIATVTNTVPVTSTYVSSATVTQTGTSTFFTGSSITVATATPTSFTTTTIPTTTTATITSTTLVIVAPTGAVKAISQTDGTTLGYLAINPNEDDFYYPISDETQAQVFMAVQDVATDLIQLQLTDGSGNVFVSESGNSGDDYSSNGSAYSLTYPGLPSLCGTSGTAPGPPEGAGNVFREPCETYVFSPSEDPTTPGAFDLLSEWVNPGQTAAVQYQWIYDEHSQLLVQVANINDFSSRYTSETSVPITLQFPA
ncbi:hypothetical protein CBS101457_004853 [Exobasidium rhododendri]|nr:hypothetical protein CBS101457_004853 [Exobasidium rhododendri]